MNFSLPEKSGNASGLTRGAEWQSSWRVKAKLEPPDLHYWNAANGWLGLGRRDEAMMELQYISAENQRHPDVLETRWAIYVQESQWDDAIEVARKLVQRAPERASGWLNHAYAVRRAPGGSLAQAWDVLRPVADKFPKDPIVHFNLACYACQMGQLDEARDWLRRALKAGDKEQIKLMALVDEDLAPLWPEIRKF